jgi:hypothetical protein
MQSIFNRKSMLAVSAAAVMLLFMLAVALRWMIHHLEYYLAVLIQHK